MAALSTLSNYLTILKLMKADNYGVFLRADVSRVVKQALEQGAETAGLTYAVFKISHVSPSMEKKDRAQAVRVLRAEVKSKGLATMGFPCCVYFEV